MDFCFGSKVGPADIDVLIFSRQSYANFAFHLWPDHPHSWSSFVPEVPPFCSARISKLNAYFFFFESQIVTDGFTVNTLLTNKNEDTLYSYCGTRTRPKSMLQTITENQALRILRKCVCSINTTICNWLVIHIRPRKGMCVSHFFKGYPSITT